jgi:hypothetical protein
MFSFFFILPSLHATFNSLDYKIDMKVGLVLNIIPYLSHFHLYDHLLMIWIIVVK